jgi:hypothetical protein
MNAERGDVKRSGQAIDCISRASLKSTVSTRLSEYIQYFGEPICLSRLPAATWPAEGNLGCIPESSS